MSRNKPAISVLMPVYNRQKIVTGAVRSIQAQTFQDWELTILDDASTDGTLDVCHALAAEDPRITVHKNAENVGAGESRNRLLNWATGEFIAIQDSDDLSLPERFAVEMQYMKDHPNIGLVSGVASCLDDHGNIFEYYPDHLLKGKPYPNNREEMVKCLFLRTCRIAPAYLARFSVFNRLQKPYGNFRLTDDLYFYLRVAHLAEIAGIPEPLIQLRRGNNHTHVWKDTAAGINELKACLSLIYQQYKDVPGSPIDAALYRKAMSALMVQEARFMGSYHVFPLLMRGLAYQPSNRDAWGSLFNFTFRGIRRIASGNVFRTTSVPDAHS
jgi:glycosyltransferase involved in cell wall biosynthesis